ncbi:MAG: helix-turn-helix transcriptional regulator [Chloroflexi bacterium]|uniref:Helix-turn-helix transcriptional regulator n=1 Tax=Candidatus Chlorohelix allophototropha TaxID=3003348 RepID=A0A8T7LYT8_9CHLR|nr:helix-turn-helix transcriptional regulator [Chloroflexota bacterium]WJW65589.1 helix-turn-helix transcriptional regulator [Chloroflexota bacterium L227-S17]
MGRKPKDDSYGKRNSQSPLALYLDRLCRERNISLRAASLAAGLGEATLGNIVRGYRHPDPATLRKIAIYFGLSEDALLEMAGHRTTNNNTSRPEINDPELRVYLLPDRINNLPRRDLNLLKDVLRHLMEENKS